MLLNKTCQLLRVDFLTAAKRFGRQPDTNLEDQLMFTIQSNPVVHARETQDMLHHHNTSPHGLALALQCCAIHWLPDSQIWHKLIVVPYTGVADCICNKNPNREDGRLM